MKKNYTAPKLMVERFELKQRIAESCSIYGTPAQSMGTPSSADKYSCGWKIGEGMILWPSAPSCTIDRSVDMDVNGTCFNNPGGGVTIFIS